ncbi:Golgi CORVET complex core vacuolar protein 8-domain-containing protein [Kalaharituber pfeilii]|nr:Golgi CORVET complex core vacuolar protein 8-domain-containing protein [Kalaharituber pfeilii]
MSLLPEGSSVLHADEHEDDGTAAEWESVRQGLEKTAVQGATELIATGEAEGGRKAEEAEIDKEETKPGTKTEQDEEQVEGADEAEKPGKIMEYLQNARQDNAEETSSSTFKGYKNIRHDSVEDDDYDTGMVLDGTVKSSSVQLSPSISDDAQSLHGSVTSSPANSAYGSRLSSLFHSPSPSLRPFDRRFQARLHASSPSPLPSTVFSSSPKRSSLADQPDDQNGSMDDNGAPWDVIRWTKLKKITSQLFSEVGRRNFGTPTCISISASIAIGTSKGIILVFDYLQNLKNVIGPGTKAVECGSITAIAISADHTTIAGGHSQGNIFTWELAKPNRPFLAIPPVASSVLESRKVDGHVEGVSVLHLGFLGTRHTALVSADGKGMAFSHLATRGFGAIVRIIKTTRILGRYPFDVPASGRPRRPSSVLAFSPLPLGNSVQATDSMGLVAILTPYLLVIISTTPVAQTQHKASRPREIANDKALSGCLAWFPAVKLKDNSLIENAQQRSSKPKLAYSWSNVLTILELSILDRDPSEDPNQPPTLQFKAKSRWECDEAIVAVQWISRQILGVLTLSQRLIILEEPALRMTETFDLMPKQIIHHRHFRYHLRPLIDNIDEEESFHPAIADAFYNSFKTYKGRIFLLCQYEVSVGALSNWADRLLAMMEVGDFIGAIRLATAYYVGEADKITVGLPEESHLRHPLVREKLLEMMAASLRYAFGRSVSSSRPEALGKDRLQELASACFLSCHCMNTLGFLFDEVFEHYESGHQEGIFLETLEPYILDRRIISIPPTVVKALTTYFTSLNQESRLEEMICHLDTLTMDIDQATTLCKKHNLYDALIYVWNRALGDYITPMIDLLSLLKPLSQNQKLPNGDSIHTVNALKIFPYLSYTLTGRIYPTGEPLSGSEAISAKAALYYFLFLGRTITWPRQSGTPFFTKSDSSPEESFPYLRLILHFDAPSFLSALNEAFEDPFLNGPADQISTEMKGEPTEEQMFARSVNRQYIITILQEVMNPNEFLPQDTIYLNMFIARNLPKYQQFILLTGSALNSVLVGLCNYPGSDIADDCQLSVEYLLSVYHPPDIDDMIELFTSAKFYRVLKSIFRVEKQYGKLFEAYLADEESPGTVFGCIEECLHPRSLVPDKQRDEVLRVIRKNSRKLVDIDVEKTAKYINQYAPELHDTIIDSIQDRSEDQFLYLRTVLEPHVEKEGGDLKGSILICKAPSLVELYVRLMCKYDPKNVPNFVERLQPGDLNLEEVLSAMEESGVVDATVCLMAREGRVRDAMNRLIKHLHSLEAALLGLLQLQTSKGNDDNVGEQITAKGGENELLESLKKYTRVGIWLCQGHVRTDGHIFKGKGKANKDALSNDELLWLDFIDTVVQIAKNCTLTIKSAVQTPGKVAHNGVLVPSTPSMPTAADQTNITILAIRKLVQDAFTALLSSTTTSPLHSANATATLIPSVSATNTSFLRILGGFLSRAALSSPSLAELRSVLAGIFDAYTYESQLLTLSNKLLDKDMFVKVSEAVALRRAGWRPLGQTCEVCGRRAWGPGAAGGIYAAWEKKRIADFNKEREKKKQIEVQRQEGQVTNRLGGEGAWGGNGKGKAPMPRSYASVAATTASLAPQQQRPLLEEGDTRQETGDLVVFRCRHVYHQVCLEKLQGNDVEERQGQAEGGMKMMVGPKKEGGIRGEGGGGRALRCVACDKSEQ